MLGSITRHPIFCSKAQILLQVKNIFFRSLMITKRLLDVVSCEFKKKCLKKGGPVEAIRSSEIFIYMGGTFCPVKKS